MTALSLFGPPEAPQEPTNVDAKVAVGVGLLTPQSLYRKYRPQSFGDDDLVGQEHIVRTIRNAIRLGRVAHAYLFCGPRGTGKTTTARLLAKAVNCLNPDPDRRPCNRCEACLAINQGSATDIIEIDAASNRGIDDIRDLRERVKYAPTQLRSKFYIVDEAHQITGAAANAFLKTLEEPPSHAHFVLATTDPEELLPTIVSRCQRFDFRRIGVDPMVGRLRVVAEREAIAIDDEALREIARHAGGSLRDALGLLDQLSLHGDESTVGSAIDAETVRGLLGISRNDRVEALLAALASRDAAASLTVVNEAVEAGEDARQLNRQLVAALRDQLHRLAGGRSGGKGSDDSSGRPTLDLGRTAQLLRTFSEVDYRIRHSPYAHLPLEIALIESIVDGPDAVAGSRDGMAIEDRRQHAPSPVLAISKPSPAQVLPQPSTSLRDRVRGSSAPPPPVSPRTPSPSSIRGNGSGIASANRPTRTEDAGTERSNVVDPVPKSPPSAPSSGLSSGTVTVEGLADLWPRIRQDVKALNRRVEALLSSFDPAQVAGERIVLATPYEFHRDKLNSEEVRLLVEQVIGRLVGGSVSVSAVLVGEIEKATFGAPPLRVVAPVDCDQPPVSAASLPVDDEITDEVSDQRVQSAKNIFDAEEEVEA
jgi:DNA polymerase-3 subunit gamma/tau